MKRHMAGEMPLSSRSVIEMIISSQ